ncbi:hypothetical protein RF11_10620 [Thelohanellus kitauei]|uniref:Uncharacterized protein n=1 Tax=Thelohanellus kitauei TaxID=669202 RepID=A0A0C2JMV1_THEKT|nr:hypothetical protein RF11_10620 [Thelohanellus kitauei]
MIKVKFLNGIYTPPPYLQMRVDVKYYSVENSSLVNEEFETYHFLIGSCKSKDLFAFSYGNTTGIKIDVSIFLAVKSITHSEFRFTMREPIEVPFLLLEDMMSITLLVVRIALYQDYVWII